MCPEKKKDQLALKMHQLKDYYEEERRPAANQSIGNIKTDMEKYKTEMETPPKISNPTKPTNSGIAHERNSRKHERNIISSKWYETMS